MEMIIVIIIIGAVMGLVLPRLLDKKSQTRKVMREFVIAGKDLRNRAKLNNITYRLAFRLDENKQAWWVEKSNKVVFIDKKKLDAERDAAKSTFRKDDEEGKAVPEFQPDTTIFKKEQTLPKGFSFKHIESGPQDLVATDGTAYIHFFPQGLIEASTIQIEDDKKNIWTLVFNPITGHSDIIPEAKTLKDLTR
ncbi:MAG: hypothetical protein H7256_03205 [Bdellovibrio sp.]|nr:hypothetical protein [Bdellovibrio sp.]